MAGSRAGTLTFAPGGVVEFPPIVPYSRQLSLYLPCTSLVPVPTVHEGAT